MDESVAKDSFNKIEEELRDLELLRTRGLEGLRQSLIALESFWKDFRSSPTGGFLKGAEVVDQRLAELSNQTNQFNHLFGQHLRSIEDSSHKLRLAFSEAEAERGNLETLYRIGKMVSSEVNFEKLLQLAMDIVIEVTGAERGFLALRDERGEPLFKVARNIEKDTIVGEKFEVSRTVIESVLKNGEPILVTDALSDPHLKNKESILALELRSILSVPLKFKEEVLGAVYVDNRRLGGIFSANTLKLLSAFAEQISIGIKNAYFVDKLERSQEALKQELRGKYKFEGIIGDSPEMLKILELAGQVASSHAPVLLRGESGTGKELLAKAIHANSERVGKPYLCINCAAIPETLLESELFGYEKGAFTGAIHPKRGKFEVADGGTIFLDEIADMSPSLQAKLLRVLQDGKFEPLGSNETREVDVRIISATNKDLEALVKEGKFREDLYYRLNVVEIKIPPLRERKTDLPLLIEFFLQKFGQECKKVIEGFSVEAKKALIGYDYPGNVRELENIIKRAVILAKSAQIQPSDLPEVLQKKGDQALSDVPSTNLELKKAKKYLRKEAVSELEKAFVRNALERSKGNIALAARRVGMDRRQFHRLLKKCSGEN